MAEKFAREYLEHHVEVSPDMPLAQVSERIKH